MTAEDFLQEHLEISCFYSDVYEETVCFSKDVQKAMKEYARLKCKELLEIVAKKAKTKTVYEANDQPSSSFGDYEYEVVDKDSILNAVDLEEFCS